MSRLDTADEWVSICDTYVTAAAGCWELPAASRRCSRDLTIRRRAGRARKRAVSGRLTERTTSWPAGRPGGGQGCPSRRAAERAWRVRAGGGQARAGPCGPGPVVDGPPNAINNFVATVGARVPTGNKVSSSSRRVGDADRACETPVVASDQRISGLIPVTLPQLLVCFWPISSYSNIHNTLYASTRSDRENISKYLKYIFQHTCCIFPYFELETKIITNPHGMNSICFPRHTHAQQI